MRFKVKIAATTLILAAWCCGAEAQTVVTQPMAGMTNLGQRVVVPAGTEVQVLDCQTVCTVAVSGFHLVIPPQFLSDRGGGRIAVAGTPVRQAAPARQAAPKQAAIPTSTARSAGTTVTTSSTNLPDGPEVIPFVPQ